MESDREKNQLTRELMLIEPIVVPSASVFFRARTNEKVREIDMTEEKMAVLRKKEWLTVAETAAYMGTTPSGIRCRIYRGQLRPKKPFGRRGRSFIKRLDIDRLMENGGGAA